MATTYIVYARIAVVCFALACTLAAPRVAAQAHGQKTVFVLSADSLKERSNVALGKLPLLELDNAPWRYYAGDDSTRRELWASREFDDSAWQTAPSFRFFSKEGTDFWKGIGWFRLRVRVDSSLRGRAVALLVKHRGASEFYCNGKLLQKFGVVGATEDAEQGYRPLGAPIICPFDTASEQVIAVRYSDARALARYRSVIQRVETVGFSLTIAEPESVAAIIDDKVANQGFNTLIVSAMGALCALHLCLFFFSRRAKEHLYYSLFTGCNVVFFGWSALTNIVHTHVDFLNVWGALRSFALVAMFPAALGFFHTVFYGRLRRTFWALAALGAAIILALLFVQNSAPSLEAPLMVYIGVCCAFIVSTLMRAIGKKQSGAWILGTGGVSFVVLLGVTLVVERLMPEIPRSYIWWIFVPLGSFLSIPISMSVYLASTVARTNRELAAKLREVEELTDKTIEQEVRAKLLEADNQRKTHELEEARKLQLSMLPQSMPVVPGLDIAMTMRTATEVGGDYYDYFADANGTLTIAIGDATGHGVKAGTMVAATKSLFTIMAQDLNNNNSAAGVLRPTSPALKRMNLRSMFMALAVVKLNPLQDGAYRALIANAGMPSSLHFRAATGEVEEILMKSMPLGTPANFPYQERELTLAKGDALVMMSDGFPERFNQDEDILGYDAATRLCSAIGGKTASEVIAFLEVQSEEWAQGAPLNDDMTFVVVRVE